MYQALYRKWRPKAFADVVGQQHITDTLRRQCAQGRLSHAYLFTGTRGTGKTTCAKILAKAVNCEHPVDGDPCNECAACRGIDSGSLLDVLELDAASNNGVDSVRALREDAIYSPASVRYRVYIVDEVHMLSISAFNALLKILEEPPQHLIFILATTELHKVPATILSRCQRFSFKRIRPQDIAERLAYVAEREGIDLRPDAGELLSRLADGALRDGLSLLDQCAAAGGVVDTARVLDILGLAGNMETMRLLDRVLRRDAQGALLLLDKLYSGGKDVSALLDELSGLVRDMLIRITAPEGGAALLTSGCDIASMDQLTEGVSPTRLIYMAGQLQGTLAGLAFSTNRRTDAELCLMRLCDESLSGDTAALAARISRLEEGGVQTPRQGAKPVKRPSAPAGDVPPTEDVPPWEDAPDFEDGPPPYGEPVVKAPAIPEPRKGPEKTAEPAAAPSAGVWQELIEKYKDQLTPMYRSMIDDAAGVLEGGELVVHCGDDLTLGTLNCDAVREVLKSVTGEYLGKPVTVRFTLSKEGAPQGDKLDELIRRGSKYEGFVVK